MLRPNFLCRGIAEEVFGGGRNLSFQRPSLMPRLRAAGSTECPSSHPSPRPRGLGIDIAGGPMEPDPPVSAFGPGRPGRTLTRPGRGPTFGGLPAPRHGPATDFRGCLYMNPPRAWLGRSVLLILLLAAGTPRAAEAPSPLIVYYYDRPPYYGVVDDRPAGFLVKMARLVFEEAGIPIRYEIVPARRVLENLRRPGNACALGWFRTPERESHFAYSREPLYQDGPFELVLRRPAAAKLPRQPTLDTILGAGLNLGVVEGYVYGPWLEPRLRTLRPPPESVNIRTDSATLCRMAAAGRIDGFFLGREESRHTLATADPSVRSALVSLPIAGAPPGNRRYLIFSRGVDPELLRRIDASLARVKRSAAYRHLLRSAKGP